MRPRLRSAAEADTAEAIRWYNEQKPGLGARFLEALDFTLESIEENPKLYPLVHQQMRRALFPRPFPYMVLFRLEGEQASIYAVLHHARNPELWKRR
ncbi:MAG TPA: type II toxin-antitoxin system RelE/ParE family toxin [Thermoanaerobaculia bacterium]|nr:type II toxin-antitoxin system RelE/ParE family toxin [Thermoanaerobaculia bacterium]